MTREEAITRIKDKEINESKAILCYDNKEQIEDVAIYSVSRKFYNDFLDYNYKTSNIVNNVINLVVKDFENRHFDWLSNPYYIILDDANIG